MGITYFLTDSSHIAEIEVKLGNLIFSEDDKKIFLDGNNGRVCYDSIMVFDTDAERLSYANPLDGFYFVSETKILWRYDDNTWTSITEPPKNNVVFIPKSELPIQGESSILYVCGTEMFTWSQEDNEYLPMEADVYWKEV